jgi:hypothetical protein
MMTSDGSPFGRKQHAPRGFPDRGKKFPDGAVSIPCYGEQIPCSAAQGNASYPLVIAGDFERIGVLAEQNCLYFPG